MENQQESKQILNGETISNLKEPVSTYTDGSCYFLIKRVNNFIMLVNLEMLDAFKELPHADVLLLNIGDDNKVSAFIIELKNVKDPQIQDDKMVNNLNNKFYNTLKELEKKDGKFALNKMLKTKKIDFNFYYVTNNVDKVTSIFKRRGIAYTILGHNFRLINCGGQVP
ncbi:MAG: hypothetical protein ACP5RS_06255 [Thermoplasmata archaeon]